MGGHRQSSENFYESDIMIVANRKEIGDYEEFVWEILERYFANDFRSVLFDFKELEYPDGTGQLDMMLDSDFKDVGELVFYAVLLDLAALFLLKRCSAK